MRRRRPPRPNTAPSNREDPDLPSLLDLEQFDQRSLSRWKSHAAALTTFHRALFFGLEPFRQHASTPLVDAICAGAVVSRDLVDWSRIVDLQYSLTPLSTLGSLRSDGGRFNIGGALSPETFTPFPALYIAEDFETALIEKFGSRPARTPTELTTLDLALRSPTSFTQFRLRGQVTQLLDINDTAALKPFVDVIKSFTMPRSVRTAARSLGLKNGAGLIRSVSRLQQQLLHPNWRMLPQHFDLPSNSQIFGRIAAAAGVHGILYPSARQSGKQCLALFPQNWRGGLSVLEVSDPAPAGATQLRIDGTTGAL